MAIRKQVTEEAIVITGDEMLSYFQNYADGADQICNATESVENIIKYEHGYGRYDDIEIVIDPPVPVEEAVREHIECLQITLDSIMEGMDRTQGCNAWLVREQLEDEYDLYYTSHGLTDLLLLFQIDMDERQVLKQFRAKIDEAINDAISWYFDK